MNYSQELLKLRDNMHCAIVNEATVRTFIKEQTTEGYIELEEPLRLYLTDYHPYKGNYTSECFVAGVHCECGDLVGEYIDGKAKYIRYTDLSMEELAFLHDYIVQQKKYKFKLYDKETI